MNRHQRRIAMGLFAAGFQPGNGAHFTIECGDVAARIHPCRTVEVARWVKRTANGGGTLKGLGTVEPDRGRGWAEREVAAVIAIAEAEAK